MPPSPLVRLLPVVMVVAVIGMIAMMVVTGGRGALANPLFFMFPLMMVMSMVGMLAGGNRGGPARSAEVNEERKDYLRYLTQAREQAASTAARQRSCAEWSHPDPGAIIGLLGSRRMWERRRGDADFLRVRVGVGTHRLATALVPPEVAPAEDLEPVSALALRRFVQAHATVRGMPTAVALPAFPAIGVTGNHDDVRGLARAMLLQLATFHGPEHLQIAIVSPDPLDPAWDWVKWLPHAGHPVLRDRLGPVRMIYPTLAALEADLADDLADRGRFSVTAPTTRTHLVVVLDGAEPAGDEELATGVGREAVTVVDLAPTGESLPTRRGLNLVLKREPRTDRVRISARTAAGLEEFGVADLLGPAQAETAGRRMARFRPASSLIPAGLDTSVVADDPGLPALLGIGDAGAFDPDRAWIGRSATERLRVPIGYTADGTPVDLDLKESAQGGMGPHGLCIGATGSGKSEFLRTLVLGLMASHSPDELNLILVDFKGGATFLGLEGAHHVAAVITNLEEEIAMVDRMRDALSGEMNRRQELLRAAGNFANVTDYEKARRAGAPLDPLPALFIVVDEFSELLAQKPDFAELFVAIGRLGRSLHIHLLLASQRLEEGKLRGLDSHLSYRIGLKTFSANESRTVLGVPDAYHLPSTPGAAYLKSDSGPPVRFSTSYVSGPYESVDDAEPDPAAPRTGTGAVLRFSALPVPIPQDEDRPDVEQPDSGPVATAPTLLETLIGRLAGHGSSPHQVWLPPLGQAVTLDGIVGADPELQVALGVIDRPYDQRRDRLILDLTGGDGNIAVVGGPQAGKSTALRTLICSAAATHTPAQTQFYCLDFGGGTLHALADLPHVSGVASKNNPDAVRRTVAQVRSILTEREQRFAATGVESMREYRALRRAGEHADDPHGDVFLVIDGLAAFRADFEALEDDLAVLTGQGLSYGIHVVISASRWADIRPAVKDLLGSRVELRLGDALDSEIGRKAAATVPTGRPGRGLTADELLLVALPRLDGDADPLSLPEATAAFVAESARLYAGREAPRVRMLPDDVALDDVAGQLTPARGVVPLGIRERDLGPATMDFTGDPHLLIFGDAGCGKTAALRTLVTGLLDGRTPEEVKVVMIDYRRTLLGAVPAEHLAGYASSGRSAGPMMAQLAGFLADRLPPEDVTAEQLAAKSWWSGPDVYLVIDDYDLVAVPSGNPLEPLLELLGHARDIGFVVVLARRSGGLGRALFDAMIARLWTSRAPRS